MVRASWRGSGTQRPSMDDCTAERDAPPVRLDPAGLGFVNLSPPAGPSQTLHTPVIRGKPRIAGFGVFLTCALSEAVVCPLSQVSEILMSPAFLGALASFSPAHAEAQCHLLFPVSDIAGGVGCLACEPAVVPAFRFTCKTSRLESRLAGRTARPTGCTCPFARKVSDIALKPAPRCHRGSC